MGAIEDIILESVKASLDSGTVEQTIRETVNKAVKDAVSAAFSWGVTNHEIKKQIDAFMVPAIQKYDLSALVPKLDAVLTDIVNNTALMDNKRILENFRGLMVEPEEKTITVSQLFEHYKRFVAENVDTDGREVDTTDEPTYVDIVASFEVEKVESRKWSGNEYLTLHFRVEEEDQQDALNVDVPVSRWKKSAIEGYDIDFKAGVDIQSLRYMSSFEVVLNRLKRAGVRVLIDKESDWDSVTPEEEPEASWS